MLQAAPSGDNDGGITFSEDSSRSVSQGLLSFPFSRQRKMRLRGVEFHISGPTAAEGETWSSSHL